MLKGLRSLFVGAVLGILVSIAVFITALRKIESPKIKEKRTEERKRVFEKWAVCCRDGRNIDAWASRHGIRSVIIYGMADIGKSLKKILKNTDIDIYCYDRNRGISEIDGETVFHDKKELPMADIALITVFDPYREIGMELEKEAGIRSVYFEEILDELMDSRDYI